MNPIRKLYADLKLSCLAFWLVFNHSREKTYFKGQKVWVYGFVIPVNDKRRKKTIQ
jgi:hypothetical protein